MTDNTLRNRLLEDASKRPLILTDCERVIQDEVNSKSGLSGVVIKTAFKVVSKVKPGFIRESMDNLLDDFVLRIEPFYEQYQSASPADSFGASLVKEKAQVADALLGITDDRAKKAPNGAAKDAYEKLRPQAKKHVEQAIPRVSQLLDKHL